MLKVLKLAIPIALLLTSCATRDSEVQVANAATNPCTFITLKTYSKKFNDLLATEIENAGSFVWPRVVRDYRQLRQAVKACKGE